MQGRRYALFVVPVFAASCAAPGAVQRAQPSSGSRPRFNGPEQVVLADSVEDRRWVHKPGIPVYPIEMLERRIEAQTIAAFVTDTTGAIEPQSISFLGKPERPFIVAVCRALVQARFFPVERGGGKRRALRLQSFLFGVEGGSVSPAHPPDVEAARRAIEREGLMPSLVELEQMAHC